MRAKQKIWQDKRGTPRPICHFADLSHFILLDDMPRSSKRRLSFTPRSAKKARRSRRSTLTVPRGVNPLPTRYACRMKYVEDISLVPGSSATGASATYLFNLNSVYDPNRTSFGTQPYGRDSLAALFGRYRVQSCKWAVEATVAGTTTEPILVWVQPRNDTLTSSTPLTNSILMEPRTIYKQGSAQAPKLFFRGKISLPKLNGVTPAKYRDDPIYGADVGATPAEVNILAIGAQSTSTNLPTVYYRVRLMYWVEWMEPITQAAS